MSDLESFVRDLISRYVASIITLDALGRGLPDGWDLDEANEPEVKRLVLRIVGYLADYERDNLSESDLRRLLGGEASWRLERASAAVNPAHPPAAPVETRVRAGADTELREALAS